MRYLLNERTTQLALNLTYDTCLIVNNLVRHAIPEDQGMKPGRALSGAKILKPRRQPDCYLQTKLHQQPEAANSTNKYKINKLNRIELSP